MTAKFQVPKPGTTITLTTRYRDYYYYSDKEWKDTTYENIEVLPPEPWFTSTQFAVSSDDPRMSFRTIDIRNVIDLSNGKAADRGSNITVTVAGSKGNHYHVTVVDGHAVSCDCPGFRFRNSCRHLAEVQRVLTSG